MVLVQKEIKKVTIRPNGAEKQIRPAGGWQPGANTQIYYKFDGNLNDDSGNNRNATAGGTVSYGTNYVDLTNGYLKVPNITYSNPTTFVFRVKRNNTTNGAFFDSQTSTAQIMRIRYDNSGSKIECYTDIPSYTNWKVLMSPSDTNWHLITIVAGPSNVIYYLDAVQKDTSSAWTGTHTATYTKIGTRSNLSTPENPAMYAGYFIVENKARTVDEISNYYNLTKGTYGL